jgi:hypothetical protein
MQDLFMLANKIPWLMAPAILITATIVISVWVAVIRLLAPASKAMVVALILALSAWAMVMRAL